jgi:hypothetical protein
MSELASVDEDSAHGLRRKLVDKSSDSEKPMQIKRCSLVAHDEHGELIFI